MTGLIKFVLYLLIFW